MKSILILFLEGLLKLLGALPQKEAPRIEESQVRDTQPEPTTPAQEAALAELVKPRPVHVPYVFKGDDREIIDEYLVDPRLKTDDEKPEPESIREQLKPDVVLTKQKADDALKAYLKRTGKI